MGGTINVAIRFKSGEAVCVDRWTNNMPYWFRNLKMYRGDEGHIRAYLAMTRNNDYLADPHATGKPQSLQNNGYGLIVWDYMTNTILDNNDYCDPVSWAEIQFVELGHPDRRNWDTADKVQLNPELIELAQAGILHAEEYYWPSPTAQQPVHRIRGPLPSEEAIALAKQAYHETWLEDRQLKSNRDSRTIVQLIADPAPLGYLHFADTPAGTKAMRAKLRELGFPFNRKEGLNATIPPVPTGKISPQEKLARELWQHWKEEPENNKFDGVPYDRLTDESQQIFLEAAEKMLADPKRVRNFQLSQMIKNTTHKVSFSVDLPEDA